MSLIEDYSSALTQLQAIRRQLTLIAAGLPETYLNTPEIAPLRREIHQTATQISAIATELENKTP